MDNNKQQNSMKRIKSGILQPGDIVLTTRREAMSAAIRFATGSDISHAMVCVADSSLIDSTSEGVQARNVQRQFIDPRCAVHVLRMADPLTSLQVQAIEIFLRSKIGTRYTKVGAVQSLAGDGTPTRRQFCSRLVAQAFMTAGIALVPNPDFCYPAELLESDRLVELNDVLEDVSAEEMAVWEGLDDVPQMMRDAINVVLAGGRKIAPQIESFDDLNTHLLRHPEDDEFMLGVLQESGYLEVWKSELMKNEWHYNEALMAALPEAQVEEYCRRVIAGEGDGPNRFVVNRGGYAALNLLCNLHFFSEMKDLYERLSALHQCRVDAAVQWLVKRNLLETDEELPLQPHSSDWFEALRIWDPKQALITESMIQAAGSSDVCSVCADDPASDYMLSYKTAGGPGTFRLCDDCYRIRVQAGEPLIPFPTAFCAK